ncbi:MAG: Do family serine endopeptidase [Nitrospirales bacterium]
MQHIAFRFRQLIEPLCENLRSQRKVGILSGVLFVGILCGSLISGFLSNPTPLNAAIAKQSSSKDLYRPDITGFATVANIVRPTVVHITVSHGEMNRSPNDGLNFGGGKFFERPFPSPPRRNSGGTGSGVLISKAGHIVTNHHVVQGVDRVTVTLLDKRQFEGRVLGLDPQTDLAVIKIDGDNFPFLTWGDSSRLQVGDYVLAIGSPFGLTASVTQGIVSGLGRGGMGITQYEDFIQTDAAINPGNSGGALVNTNGELIGINTAIFSRTGGYQGIGFAVPSGMVQSVYDSVLENGKVIRGYLGVGIQALTPELAKTFQLANSNGALVTDVKSGSPAASAGLKRGDAVVRYQESPINTPRALQREVMQTPVGSSVTLTVMRNGEEKIVQATILEQSSGAQVATVDARKPESHLAGITVDELNEVTAQQLGVKRKTKGVVVTNVLPGSAAAQAGVTRGDIIQEVNRNRISSLDEYQQVTTNLKKGQSALLFIERRGAPLFLSVRV